MTPEKLFEYKIKQFLIEKKCWYVKFFANAYTKSGIPDILACVNGYFVAIEVKATNGKPSELQLYNKDKIRDSGGISIVLYPNQFNNFKKLINELLNNKSLIAFVHQLKFDKEADHEKIQN